MLNDNSNILSNQIQFKRRISIEQLNELTVEQKRKLQELWKPEKGDWFNWNGNEEVEVLYSYDGWSNEDLSYESDPPHEFTEKQKKRSLPLLDIGQMIELLHCFGYIDYTCQPMPVEVEQNGRKEYCELDFDLKFDKCWYWINSDGERIVVDNNKLVWQYNVCYNSMSGNTITIIEKELCAALWVAVKEVL